MEVNYNTKKMKNRFQNSNRIVKLWRYRHYFYILFKWLYWSVFSFRVYHHENPNEYDVMRGKQLWRLLKGVAQIDMNWLHTMEEVQNNFKNNYGKEEKI